MTAERAHDPAAFESARDKRRGVRQASAELEEALARPAGKDAKEWSVQVDRCLGALVAAFRKHVEHSEGEDGLLPEIVGEAPRLSSGVERIKREHAAILRQLVGLEGALRGGADEAEIPVVREEAARVLDAVAGHRQRGADLIYEAYSVDIEAGD